MSTIKLRRAVAAAGWLEVFSSIATGPNGALQISFFMFQTSLFIVGNSFLFAKLICSGCVLSM